MKLKSFINKNLFSNYAKNLSILPLLATLLLFLFLIPFDLFLSPTLPTGGDHPGHFYNLNTILESMNFRNWNPSNLGGEVLNGHYFPMIFIILTLFSYLTGPLISYKLFLIFSLFSVPLLIYFLVYKKSRNHWTASLPLIFSLILNFYSNNFNWGLSALSSAIGLISHNLAFFFLLLFLDRLFSLKDFKSLDHKLLFYILGTALSHPYVAINIPIVFIAFIFFQADKKTFLIFTLKNFILILLLSCWWLFPMLNNLENNSSFSFRFINLKYWQNYLSKSMLFYLLTIGLFLFVAKKKSAISQNKSVLITILFLLSFTLICLILFPFIGLVDGRVLGHLFYCFFALLFFFALTLDTKYFHFLTIALFVSFLPLHFSTLSQIKVMLKNSWQGPFHSQEATQIVTTLKEVIKNENLNNQNRLAYEFNPIFMWKFGSDRFFETLPPYIGKPTFDGLYIQTNQYSKYAHYFQSLLGINNQCLKEDKCSSVIDLKKAAELMPILGIDTLFLTSYRSQEEARRAKRFFDHSIKLPFGTILIKRNINNVVVNESKVLKTQDWKRDYYNVLKNLPLPLETKNNCHPSVEATLNQLTLKTDCPGKPHILKYMYLKDFHFSNASLFRAPYGYIGIVPFQETTVLNYGETSFFQITRWISIISFIGLIFYFCFRKKLAGSRVTSN